MPEEVLLAARYDRAFLASGAHYFITIVAVLRRSSD